MDTCTILDFHHFVVKLSRFSTNCPPSLRRPHRSLVQSVKLSLLHRSIQHGFPKRHRQCKAFSVPFYSPHSRVDRPASVSDLVRRNTIILSTNRDSPIQYVRNLISSNSTRLWLGISVTSSCFFLLLCLSSVGYYLATKKRKGDFSEWA